MATRPVLIPDVTWKGVGPNATQKDLKRKGKFPNYKSPGLLLKNLRNGMYGLLCEFGKWLWNCGETIFVIVESLWFSWEIALILLEIALGNSGSALIWIYEGDIGELLEILGICLKIGNSRPKRMTCFRMPSQETHSARVWQGCLGPEVYITCVCCPHSGPVMLVWCW